MIVHYNWNTRPFRIILIYRHAKQWIKFCAVFNKLTTHFMLWFIFNLSSHSILPFKLKYLLIYNVLKLRLGVVVDNVDLNVDYNKKVAVNPNKDSRFGKFQIFFKRWRAISAIDFASCACSPWNKGWGESVCLDIFRNDIISRALGLSSFTSFHQRAGMRELGKIPLAAVYCMCT